MCRKILFFLVVLGTNIQLTAGDTLYVKIDATGLPANGTTWEQAFRSLDAALSTVQYGDQIWVAEGTYKPDGQDRDLRFNVPTGVALYGGFAGWETALAQRVPGTSNTILSGDIGIAGDQSDNCYTIVYFEDPDAGNVIDGFALRYGNADYPDPLEPYMSERRNGAAIYATSSIPGAQLTIRNCLFEHNVALYAGGAVCIWSPVGIAPFIADCTFSQNVSGASGGGLSMLAGMATRGVCVTGCVFRDNESVIGGGFELLNSRSDSIVITGCMFEGNAGVSGSGLRVWRPTAHVEYLEIYDSDFRYNINEGTGVGGALNIHSGNFSTGYEMVLVKDCEFIRQQVNAGVGGAYGLKCSSVQHMRVDGALFESDAISLGGFGQYPLEVCELSNIKMYDVRNSWFIDVANAATGSRTEIVNSQIFDNSGSMRFGGSLDVINSVIALNSRYHPQADRLLLAVSLRMHNSIFWRNTLNALRADTVTCSHLITDMTDFDTLFIDGANVELDAIQYQTDPLFKDIGSRDFRLRSCSPGVNAGSNAITLNTGIDHDFEGNPRIIDDIVDIGAFEHPTPFKLSVGAVHSISCHGDTDGSIDLEMSGTEPLDFFWESDSATGYATTGFVTGNYRLHLSDGDECMDSIDVTIAEPDLLILSTEVESISCFGERSGSANVYIEGGTTPYTIIWSTGASGNFLDGIGAGNYSVTVADANACSTSYDFAIQQPPPITLEYLITHPESEISFDGSIFIEQIQGGVPPYQLMWQDGSGSMSQNQLPPGQYNLTVIDQVGCSVKFVFTLEARTILGTDVSITLWPNPINRTRTLKVEVVSGTTLALQMEVFDVLGREMVPFAQIENIHPGTQVFEYAFDLPYAMYFVRFSDHDRRLELFKVIVVSD